VLVKRPELFVSRDAALSSLVSEVRETAQLSLPMSGVTFGFTDVFRRHLKSSPPIILPKAKEVFDGLHCFSANKILYSSTIGDGRLRPLFIYATCNDAYASRGWRPTVVTCVVVCGGGSSKDMHSPSGCVTQSYQLRIAAYSSHSPFFYLLFCCFFRSLFLTASLHSYLKWYFIHYCG
jgi:hypothetical protein